jgi:group I intron endonuclease
MKKNKLKCGIYRIRNLINNDCYIGQSINLEQRKYYHFYYLKRNKSRHPILQNACNKYGIENFVFEIMLYCDKENLTYYEQTCVDRFDPKYNCRKECVNSPRGTKHKVKTVENMKKAQRKRYLEEYKKEYPELHNNFVCKNLNNEEEYNAFHCLDLKLRSSSVRQSFFKSSYSLFDNKIPKIVDIAITKNELKIIKSLNTYREQKLLFALLVLSKYYFLSNNNYNYFYHKKISSLFAFANVHTSKEKQDIIINSFIKMGYISNIDNGLKINFIDNDSDVVIFTNKILETMELLPSYCSVCGKQIEKKVHNHEYCKECWKTKNKNIQKEQMRIRRGFYDKKRRKNF